MKNIRITAGYYGRNVSGTIVPVKAGDPPFEIDDAAAKRLVRLGVAEYVDGAPAQYVEPGDTLSGTGGDGLVIDIPGLVLNEQMKRPELDAIAIEYGLDPSKYTNKGALIDAIKAALAATDDADDEDAEDEDNGSGQGGEGNE